MKTKNEKLNPADPEPEYRDNNDLKGYPLYPANEDVYEQLREERDLDPEDVTRQKPPNSDDLVGTGNLPDFRDTLPGRDLDIPGTEPDALFDPQGNEDEENKYYSLGDNEA